MLVELLAVVRVEDDDRVLREPRPLQVGKERRQVRVGPVDSLVVHGHRVGDVVGGRVHRARANAFDRVEAELERAREGPVEVLALVGVQEGIVRVGRVEEDEEAPGPVLLDPVEHARHLHRERLLLVAEEVPSLVEPEGLRHPALDERGRLVAAAPQRLRDEHVLGRGPGRDAEDLRPVLLVPLLLHRELRDVARGQHRGVRGQRVGRLRDRARKARAAGGEQRRGSASSRAR